MKRPKHWTYHEQKVRAAVLRRDNFECQIRGEGCLGRATEVDHIVAKSAGGKASPDNLRAACRTCNRRKGSGSDVLRPMVVPPGSRWGVVTSDYSRRGGR